MKITYFFCAALLCFLGNAYSQDLNDQIDALLGETVADEGPGVSIGVLIDGQVSYHNQKGLATLEYNIPLNDETLSLIFFAIAFILG